MKKPLTRRSCISRPRNRYVKSSRFSICLSLISVVIALVAAIFSGLQSYMAKQTYSVNLKQAKNSEDQTEVARQALQASMQANTISQTNIQLIERQLKRAAIEDEIKRLEAVNPILMAGHLSILDLNLSKSNFEISKNILMKQAKSPDERRGISKLLDGYWLYFTKIAPITPHLPHNQESYRALAVLAKNISLLSAPSEISKWDSRQCQQFLREILDNINAISMILQNNLGDNQKKIAILREQLQNL